MKRINYNDKVDSNILIMSEIDESTRMLKKNQVT